MKNIKLIQRFTALLLISVFAVFFVSGCAQTASPTPTPAGAAKPSTSASTTDTSKKPITVNVVFAKGMTGIGNQFGIAKGFYEKAGITLNDITTTNVVAAFSSGQVDIADGDPGTYVPASANGVPFKIVANMWRSTGAFWIIANNSIKTFADLKGKKVGTATPSGGMRITTLEVLSKNGLDPEKDVTLIANGTNQQAYATLISGQVDATIIHQPFATLAEKEGTGHALAKTWEFVTDYQTGAVVASDNLIKNRPDDLQRVLDVYFEANEYARTHPDEFYTWAAGYLNQSLEVVKAAVESERVLWIDDPIVNPSRLTATQKLLVKYNFLPQVLPVDNVVNNTFAEVTAKKLKLGKYAAK
jgi:NitT/TauT family transport system substrate-binding protein